MPAGERCEGLTYIKIVGGRIQVEQTPVAQAEQEITVQVVQIGATVHRVIDYRVGSGLQLRNVVQVQTGQVVDRQSVVMVAGHRAGGRRDGLRLVRLGRGSVLLLFFHFCVLGQNVIVTLAVSYQTQTLLIAFVA